MLEIRSRRLFWVAWEFQGMTYNIAYSALAGPRMFTGEGAVTFRNVCLLYSLYEIAFGHERCYTGVTALRLSMLMPVLSAVNIPIIIHQ